jgi:hypothetical protein
MSAFRLEAGFRCLVVAKWRDLTKGCAILCSPIPQVRDRQGVHHDFEKHRRACDFGQKRQARQRPARDRYNHELKKRKVEEATRIEPKDYVASQGAHGVGVIETIVIAYLGGLATAAGATTWNKIIWPSLKARLGGKIKRKAE